MQGRKYKIAIPCKSKKQSIIAQSTIEAEYISMNEGVRELIALKNIIESIGINLSGVDVYTDNKAALSISKTPRNNEITKNIDIKYHYVRELVLNRKIDIYNICTELNPADVFTNVQNINNFNNARQKFGLKTRRSGGVLETVKVETT